MVKYVYFGGRSNTFSKDKKLLAVWPDKDELYEGDSISNWPDLFLTDKHSVFGHHI